MKEINSDDAPMDEGFPGEFLGESQEDFQEKSPESSPEAHGSDHSSSEVVSGEVVSGEVVSGEVVSGEVVSGEVVSIEAVSNDSPNDDSPNDDVTSQQDDSATPATSHRAARQSAIAIAVLLSVLTVALNWPLRYAEIGSLGGMDAVVDFDSSGFYVMPRMAGWPCHYWIHYDEQGNVPAVNVFSGIGLLINVVSGALVIGLICWYLYRRGLRQVGGRKSNIRIADLLLITLLLAAPFGWWQYQKTQQQAVVEIVQRYAKDGDSVHVSAWVPALLRDRLPQWLSSNLQRVRGVRLEHPSDAKVAEAVAIPTLTHFRVGGGEYDLSLLDDLGRRIHLIDVRISGRQLDTPTVEMLASNPRVHSLNLMRTNVDAGVLNAMGQLPALRRLNLMHSDVHLADLGRPPWADWIEIMILPHPESGGADELILDQWPELQELNINELDVPLNATAMKVQLSGLPKLTTLRLDRFQAFDLTLTDLPKLTVVSSQKDNWTSRIARGGKMPGLNWLKRFHGRKLPELETLEAFVCDLESLSINEVPMLRDLGLGVYQIHAEQGWNERGGPQEASTYPEQLDPEVAKAIIQGVGSSDGPATIDLDAVPLSGVDLTPLAGNQQIQNLYLGYTNTNLKQWKQLAGLKRLKQLRLDGNMVAMDDVEILLDQFPELESLEFANDGRRGSGMFMSYRSGGDLELIGRPNLKSITMDHSTGGMFETVRVVDMPMLQADLDFQWISQELEIRNSPSLTGLSIATPLPEKITLRDLRDLNHFAVGGQAVDDAFLSQIAGCDKLSKLTLAYVSASEDALSKLPLQSITHLYLPGCNVDDAVVEKWPEMTSLTSVDLSETKITNASLNRLLHSKLLTNVNLNHCPIDPAALNILATKDSLTSLSLAGIGLDASTLESLLQVSLLEYINVSGTTVPDDVLDALANVQFSPKLLVLRDCKLDSQRLLALMQKQRGLLIDPTGSNLATEVYTRLLSQQRIVDEDEFNQRRAMEAALAAAQPGIRVGFPATGTHDSIIDTDSFSPDGQFGERAMAARQKAIQRRQSEFGRPSTTAPSTGVSGWLQRMLLGSSTDELPSDFDEDATPPGELSETESVDANYSETESVDTDPTVEREAAE
ncbi:leucine-rich repeat domain-containing protein [Stieleria varia]|uniref:Leucine Rich repeats (2 copies) n=1 Tax=Stieleria varia TaxID=2528005 RepID=A0A5C6AZC1_9BACT|nr:hypothetical protein [Stieleria varia]TWU05040.1 Leucine Rich repeats (2 copies) [Stieleria varia]